MNILHIDLERGWRGGQQQVAYLMHHLRDLGCSALLAGRPGEPITRWAEKGGWPAIPAVPWPTAAWRVARRARAESVTIVHAHSSRSHNLGLLLKLLCPGISLVVSRRVDFHRRPGILNRWKYRTRLVGHWVAISERVRAVLVDDGVPPERIAVIHSGIDASRIEGARPPLDERSRLRNDMGVSKGECLIGSVGALVPHKDRETLIRAMALAVQQGLPLKMAIAGEGGQRSALETLIGQLGLEQRVSLLGQRDDVPRLLHLFDLFALSSREEGLGTSVLDAMAAGLPVIVTEAGGLPEMIRNRRNGLVVPPADPAALAEALVSVVQDASFRASAGRNNREDVKRFSARSTAEKTLELYRRVSGETARK